MRTSKSPGTALKTADLPAHLGFQFDKIWTITGLLGLSLLLQSLLPAPRDIWPLAYIAMVPWLIVIGGTSKPRWVYVSAWMLGFAFFLINMAWMEVPTGAGYIALSAFLACYFPLAACPIRHAVRRRRIPLSVAFPVVWVGAEYLRGIVLSGFPWFFLGHSHHGVLPMIQISDLVGAYGVTFVLAALNGAVADVLFWRIKAVDPGRRKGQRVRAHFSIAFASLLLVATLGYGWFRLDNSTLQPGPRIALLQQNYPNFTDRAASDLQPGPLGKRDAYFKMMEEARLENPDLYLFPETAWACMYLNQEFINATPEDFSNPIFESWQGFSRNCYMRFTNWTLETGASLVVGSSSSSPSPHSLRTQRTMHNSAFHFTPDGKPPARHDKIHPVLFGETVPFRYGRLRFVYLWLNSLSPFGADGYEYSLTAGEDVHVFTMTTPDGKKYRFGVPICYEDVMPYVCRRFVWDPETRQKRVDFLLNISNDGWFGQRNEQEQHMAICTFRAIENRVGIARTVNTGVSGFIDPNGRVYNALGVGETAFKVDQVITDSRVSLYSKIGDIFAFACAIVWLGLYLDYIGVRIIQRRRMERATRQRSLNRS